MLSIDSIYIITKPSGTVIKNSDPRCVMDGMFFCLPGIFDKDQFAVELRVHRTYRLLVITHNSGGAPLTQFAVISWQWAVKYPMSVVCAIVCNYTMAWRFSDIVKWLM